MKTYSKYLFQLIQLATLVVLICSSAKPGIAEVYNEEFLFKKLDQLFAANRDNFKDKELKKIIQDKKRERYVPDEEFHCSEIRGNLAN